MRAALLVTWPVHRDFPFFRWMIKKNHHLFEDVIVAFSNENQQNNYKGWIINDLPFIKFTSPFLHKSDWRDDAVNSALTLETKADTYIFFEPDFLVSTQFWPTILSSHSDFIYYSEERRVHPAFAAVSRTLIEKTTKDFSAHPDDKGLDHFGVFFEEIRHQTNEKELRQLLLEEKKDFYHLGGTTQNYWNAENNQPFHRPKEFLQYNYLSMMLPHQNPSFYKQEFAITEKYGYSEKETFLDHFFPTDRTL